MAEDQRPLLMVIDDRRDILHHCERCLGEQYSFVHYAGGRPGLAALATLPVSAVLLDRDFSQGNPADLIGPRSDVRNEGLHILESLRTDHPDLPVIMVTGHRDMATAVRATKLKADFVAWEDMEAEPAILAARLQRALDRGHNGNGVGVAAFRRLGIVAESAAFRAVLAAMYCAVPGTAPICLLGNTGTGKDTLAYGVHCLSGDARRPFVVVNVASIAPTLMAAALFGTVPGAFNDARESTGLLRAAHGGTLFLNEIGRLPLEQQSMLLTALDRKEVRPVGAVRSQAVDFRLITATSRDLHALMDQGEFQRDLFHRIAWHTFTVPALAQRVDDIPPLAYSFLRGTDAFKAKRVVGISKEALEYLAALPWPGNVRELQSVIEACAVSSQHTITVADIHEAVTHGKVGGAGSPCETGNFRSGAAASADPESSTTGPEHGRQAEDLLFSGRDLHEVMLAYYRHLLRSVGGNMAHRDESGPRSPRARASDAPGDPGADAAGVPFAGLTHADVRRAYYFYLKRVERGNMRMMALHAGVAKSTIYEWKKEFDLEMEGEA